MKDHRGFSLVELIVVISIVAVLISILAPQYLKYVEKSRKSTDVNTIEVIEGAIKTVSSNPSDYDSSLIGLENGEYEITFQGKECKGVTGVNAKTVAVMEKAIEEIVRKPSEIRLRSTHWGNLVIKVTVQGDGGVQFSYTNDGSCSYADYITKGKVE